MLVKPKLIGYLLIKGKSKSEYKQKCIKLSAEATRDALLKRGSKPRNNLGRFSAGQSRGGVDSKVILEDGDLLIQTPLGRQIPVRGARPDDDTVSVRDVLGSALAKANAINGSTDQHGVTAIAGPTVAVSDQSVGAANLFGESYLQLNGVQVSGISVSDGDTDETLSVAINALSEQTGVKAKGKNKSAR